MKSIKGLMLLIIGLSLALTVHAGTVAIDTLQKQIASNPAVGFMNGYWIKPIDLKNGRTGVAFVPHGSAEKMGLKDVAAVAGTHEIIDKTAHVLSAERLDIHDQLDLNAIIIVEITDELLDLGIINDDWWGGYFDCSGSDAPPYGWGGDPVDDFTPEEDKWWEQDPDDPIYGSDENDTSIGNGDGGGSSGGCDSDEEEDPPHGWSDDPQQGDNIIGGNCPPPSVCLQTIAVDLFAVDADLLQSLVAQAYASIEVQAKSAITLQAPIKGAAAYSMIEDMPFRK